MRKRSIKVTIRIKSAQDKAEPVELKPLKKAEHRRFAPINFKISGKQGA